MASECAEAARAFLRAVNALGARAAEALWASAAALAGSAAGSRSVSLWSSSGHERVLAVAPHPDDEAIGCAGTLIRHRQQGDSVRSVVVTDGSRSRALGLDPQTMAKWREREAGEAAARMGIESRWIGLLESDWSDDEARQAIREQLVEADPTIIYAPSAFDYHPDHRRVARALAAAIAELQVQPEVRIYAVQVPLTPLLAGLVHDVSDLQVRIRSVLGCYASQRESIAITTRLRHYAARFYGRDSEVEAFCALTAEDFVSLHARPEVRFRPLMIRAWTDPLTVLVGLPERLSWRLRESVRAIPQP